MTREERKRITVEAPTTREGFFLVGPTASGKTTIAHRLAARLKCPILSADSMLVYRGMEIGTDKPTAAVREVIEYYGIDVAYPCETFSVGRYLECVRDTLPVQIGRPGSPLLVAGGTGLYIRALTSGLDDVPPASPSVREYWQGRLAREGIRPLQDTLRAKSASIFEGLSDISNPRRLIRGLELADAGLTALPQTKPPAGARATGLVGIRRSVDALNRRIEERVRRMFRSGLVEEVRKLCERVGSLSATARHAIGYAEAMDLLAGRGTAEEAIARTIVRSRRLAKRQRTWFNHQADVRWVDVPDDMSDDSLAERVELEWRKLGATQMAI